jgi:hypothetical protein
MSHTPGPWKIFEGWGADKRRPVIVDSIPDVDGKFVGNCICYAASTNPDMDGNANLIASAPDLLAACKGAMRIVSLWGGREVPEDHEHAEEMKALHMMQEAFIEAIAKAEGRDLDAEINEQESRHHMRHDADTSSRSGLHFTH